MKIRHFGILGNRNKTEKLMICKTETNTPIIEKLELSTLDLIEQLIGERAFRCTCCNSDHLTRYTHYAT